MRTGLIGAMIILFACQAVYSQDASVLTEGQRLQDELVKLDKQLEVNNLFNQGSLIVTASGLVVVAMHPPEEFMGFPVFSEMTVMGFLIAFISAGVYRYGKASRVILVQKRDRALEGRDNYFKERTLMLDENGKVVPLEIGSELD